MIGISSLVQDGQDDDPAVLEKRVDRVGEAPGESPPHPLLHLRVEARVVKDALDLSLDAGEKLVAQPTQLPLIPVESIVEVSFRLRSEEGIGLTSA